MSSINASLIFTTTSLTAVLLLLWAGFGGTSRCLAASSSVVVGSGGGGGGGGGGGQVATTTADNQVCQCITHSGTGGHEWGALIISPNISSARGGPAAAVAAANGPSADASDCLVIYIRAAPDEIVELRFYEIILRQRCQDSIQIHAHLRTATISETARNDEIICAERAGQYIANRHPHAIDQLWEEHVAAAGGPPAVVTPLSRAGTIDADAEREQASRIHVNNRQAILSSSHLMAVHLRFNSIGSAGVSAKADFRFHKKALFKIDGNLLPTTLCDYQFLPHPINYYAHQQQPPPPNQQQRSHQPQRPMWRYFYSPRYPAKYAGHVKCAYKFIGRPNGIVEVVFQEIDLPPAIRNASKSCIDVSDRLTIYDGRTPDTSAIVDVLCQARNRTKKILSSGAHLLIEFESSSNRSANGFSAKYRFVETLHHGMSSSSSSSGGDSAPSPQHNRQSINDAQWPMSHHNNRSTTSSSSSSSGHAHGQLLSSNDAAVNQQLDHRTAAYDGGRLSPVGRPTDNGHTDNDDDDSNNSPPLWELKSTRTDADNDANDDDDGDHHRHPVPAGVAQRTAGAPILIRAGNAADSHIGTMPSTTHIPPSDGSNNDGSIGDISDGGNIISQPERRASTRCPPPVSNCDVVYSSNTSKSGIIMSPMFPSAYAPKTYCRFEFRGSGQERIQLSFMEFTLPSEGDGDDCEQADTLQVLMPIKGRFEPVEVLCGHSLPKPIMSNGPRMLIEFRGRKSGRGNRGIRAEYKFLENFGITSGRQLPTHECSFEYNSSVVSNGWFLSPNFPGNYPRNIECNYYFHGNAMEKVNIRFSYFDVEGIFPCDEESSSDTVEFSNFQTVDRKFSLHCEKKPIFDVRSDGKFFRVTFRSNDRLDGTGFSAEFKFETVRSTGDDRLTTSAVNRNHLSDPSGKQSQKQQKRKSVAKANRANRADTLMLAMAVALMLIMQIRQLGSVQL